MFRFFKVDRYHKTMDLSILEGAIHAHKNIRYP